jgi:hypothetical protein
MLRSFLWLLGLVLAVSSAGCGPQNNPVLEKTIPVHGKVVAADGSPVRGGQITFHPKDPTKGEARGSIGKDGSFELGTYGVKDGAMPGSYTVSVEPMVYDQQGNMRPDPSLRIPPRFADAKASGLTAEVQDGDQSELTIVLR